MQVAIHAGEYRISAMPGSPLALKDSVIRLVMNSALFRKEFSLSTFVE